VINSVKCFREINQKTSDVIILLEATRDVIKTFDKCAVGTSCLLISKLISEGFCRQRRLNPFLNKQFFCNSGEDWGNRYGTKVSQTIRIKDFRDWSYYRSKAGRARYIENI
jgi:hypothetical protein